jgi:hypothetical protein
MNKERARAGCAVIRHLVNGCDEARVRSAGHEQQAIADAYAIGQAEDLVADAFEGEHGESAAFYRLQAELAASARSTPPPAPRSIAPARSWPTSAGAIRCASRSMRRAGRPRRRRLRLPSVSEAMVARHRIMLDMCTAPGYLWGMTNTPLSKLCYCQSARHARAAVRALENAGYAARTDASGYVFVDNPTEAASGIASAAIKAA